jgi:hypothetical protein
MLDCNIRATNNVKLVNGTKLKITMSIHILLAFLCLAAAVLATQSYRERIATQNKNRCSECFSGCNKIRSEYALKAECYDTCRANVFCLELSDNDAVAQSSVSEVPDWQIECSNCSGRCMEKYTRPEDLNNCETNECDPACGFLIARYTLADEQGRLEKEALAEEILDRVFARDRCTQKCVKESNRTLLECKASCTLLVNKLANK